MLEDLHHFDSISWSFLTTVAEKMSDQVLVVATIRPNDGVLSVASRHEEGEAQGQLVQTQAVPIIYPQYNPPYILWGNCQLLCVYDVRALACASNSQWSQDVVIFSTSVNDVCKMCFAIRAPLPCPQAIHHLC